MPKMKPQGADGGDDKDEVGAEPVQVFAAVGYQFHAAQGQRDQGGADIVEGRRGFFLARHHGGIFDVVHDAEHGEDADGDVDEEDEVPGVVVRQPAADHGADDRGDDGGDGGEGESGLRFSGGKVSRMMACWVGCRPPPKKPCTARQSSNCGKLVERPQPSEAMVKTAMQMRKKRLRPMRRLSDPEMVSTMPLAMR